MLRNAMGMDGSTHMSVMKVYSQTLLVLRGGGGVRFPEKSIYVTLEWHLRQNENLFKSVPISDLYLN